MSRAFWVVLFLCTILRLSLFIYYHPRATYDTTTYENLASKIRELDLTGHDGARTPVFPLILALAKNNREIVFAFHSFLGIVTTALLFLLTQRTTNDTTAAVIVALSYSLGLQWLSYEMYMLTETLSLFLVVLFVFLFEITIRMKSAAMYVLLGSVAAMATLTRPILIVLVFVGFAFLLYIHFYERRFRNLAYYVLPIALSLLGWCYINKIHTGYFTLTTLSGYSLTNHSGAFMERAPDKYRFVRDIYLKKRDEYARKTGSHAMTIFQIDEAMRKETGYSYGKLSEELRKLSIDLFIANPSLYAKSVLKAWINFWRPPGPSNQLSLARYTIGRTIFYIQTAYYLILYFAVLLISVLSLTPAHSILKLNLFDYFCISVIFAASVLQALIEYGDNPRYGLPFHPLTIYLAIAILSKIDFRFRVRNSKREFVTNSRMSV
jgi:hypothetical protein